MKNYIDSEKLSFSDKSLQKRYSERLDQFGISPKTLGWDTKENQWRRFGLAKDSLNFSNRSLLDVGCGLADFYTYLTESAKQTPSHYTGFDINEDLIDACKLRYPDLDFEVRNLLLRPAAAAHWDIVTLFGVVNFRFKEFDNEIFARQMIETAFKTCRQSVAIDMLSSVADPSYPQEDFVYYYDPVEMLKFALTLTPYVQVRHDQSSIPQREFLLVLRKTPWIS